MKKSRFTEEQIAYALKQAETGTPVAEVLRRMGISEQTFYRWKKLYVGLGTGQLRRLKQLEEENRKLKQLVADLSLDKHILQDVLSKKLRAPLPRPRSSLLMMCYGPEFVSKTLDRWAYENAVTLDFSRPGKPTDNAYVESFNGRLRDECLNANWFLSLTDAKAKIEAWRRHYNESRPHTALGWLTPHEFALAAVQRAAE